MGEHSHTEPPSEPTLRIKALESLLVDKGLVDPGAVDEIIELFEKRIGPRNGAKVVAHAWADPAYKKRLLEDGSKAIAELGFSGLQGEDMVVLENTPSVHNVVVCTLCSCYPWPTMGLPPNWYKAAPYRARVVIEPRKVLAEFGVDVAPNADAARRHRRLERRKARRPRHTRCHDRHRYPQGQSLRTAGGTDERDP
jgi:nitrile hydratase subunit alpha